MSLDVYLKSETPFWKQATSGIFIREGGKTFEISREEWDRRKPGVEPVAVVNQDDMTNDLYHDNITHNLTTMAKEAGIYKELWRPEELGVEKAWQLICPLSAGLVTLLRDPAHFKTFDPENGWGNYDVLVEFVKNYLRACIDNPDAKVEVCR